MSTNNGKGNFTPIPNNLLDWLPRQHLTGCDWDVLAVVIRKTTGWHKAEEKFSLGALAKATRRPKLRLRYSLKHLQAIGLIKQTKSSSYSTAARYALNDEWRRGVSETNTGYKTNTVSQSVTQHSVPNSTLAQGTKPYPVKRNKKETKEERKDESFFSVSSEKTDPDDKRLTPVQLVTYRQLMQKKNGKLAPSEIEMLEGLERIRHAEVCE